MSGLNIIEEVEQSTQLLVTESIKIHMPEIVATIEECEDFIQDACEDITREALDSTMPKLKIRLPSKTDYKAARIVAHPKYVMPQALFVDTKAEKSDRRTMTLQRSQTSMIIKQIRNGELVCEKGDMPKYISSQGIRLLTTTVFVKYCYKQIHDKKELSRVIIATVPNGYLQERYNPTHEDSFWRAGRNAPSLGEEFRVRVSFKMLAEKAKWRVKILKP